MHKQISVAFDVVCILSVKMDEVGVKGQRRVPEEQRARWCKCMREVWFSLRCCSLLARCCSGYRTRHTLEIFGGSQLASSDCLDLCRRLLFEEDEVALLLEHSIAPLFVEELALEQLLGAQRARAECQSRLQRVPPREATLEGDKYLGGVARSLEPDVLDALCTQHVRVDHQPSLLVVILAGSQLHTAARPHAAYPRLAGTLQRVGAIRQQLVDGHGRVEPQQAVAHGHTRVAAPQLVTPFRRQERAECVYQLAIRVAIDAFAVEDDGPVEHLTAQRQEPGAVVAIVGRRGIAAGWCAPPSRKTWACPCYSRERPRVE
jgi:hypothetical protein